MSKPPSTDFVHRLQVGGRERWCQIHLPPSFDRERPLPIVFALHGATSNPRLMERFTGLNEKADADGFIVGYPAGSGALANVLTWNGGACCGYAANQQIDDVAFFRALLDDLPGVLRLDPGAIYLAGMSNGAHMSYRLGAAMADRFAAIACVAGPMAIELETAPARPISVLHIHGSDDEFAPFEGGRGAKSLYGISLPSVPDSVMAWVRVNRCPPTPREEVLPDSAGDGTHIVRWTYAPGAEGSEVILIKIEGGGHTWPGRPPLPLTLGKSTTNLNANDEIWSFFCRHRRD
jgi:polyhydroxybutyrate depolymerase